MFGGEIETLVLDGNGAKRGALHGTERSTPIRKYLSDRMALAAEETWSGAAVDESLIVEAAEEMLPHHERFSGDLYAEMVAMGETAGISAAEAVVVGGFTDLVDVVRSRAGSAPEEHNCTAVLNRELGFYAQTWDMHASAGEFVVLLDVRPDSGPRALVQTTAGCLGQMGMNEAGIAIGINNLTSIGRPGVTWPTVVRKVLTQTSFDDAVEVILSAPLAGGHNFMVMGPAGEGVNIEAMPSHKEVTRVHDAFVHTNHCLFPGTVLEEGERLSEHVENSNRRLEVAEKLADDLEAFFEEPTISRRVGDLGEVGTCGAVILEPGPRRMRVVWGLPGEHPWEEFTL